MAKKEWSCNDVITLRILRGRLCWIIWVGPKCDHTDHTCPNKRETSHTEEEKAILLQAKEWEAGGGKEGIPP